VTVKVKKGDEEMELWFRKAQGFAKFHDVYQWSVNGRRWYWVHRRDIVFATVAERIRELLNRVLRGEVLRLDGCYVRETKTLALIA